MKEKNKDEVVMVNETTGKETEVHMGSVAAMEACGWKLKKGEKVPESFNQPPIVVTGTPVSTTAPTRTPEEQAERDSNDAGAKKATVAQLREALDQLAIKHTDDMKKADLLALYIARP